MDIITEADMFSEDPQAFKNLSYSTPYLGSPSVCIMLTRRALETEDMHDSAGALALVNKRQEFLRTLWDKRYLIHRDGATVLTDKDDIDEPFSKSFSYPASSCVIIFITLSRRMSVLLIPIFHRRSLYSCYHE